MMTTSHPSVAVVILNTNRRSDTLECLQSLSSNRYEPLSVFVIDNSSTDGSVEAIQKSFPEVQVINLAQNKGYAGNNNVGIDLAIKKAFDWILVLNEDTLMAPDFIEQLVFAGDTNSEIGVVGPLVYHNDEPEVIQSAGALMDKNWRSYHIGHNEKDIHQYSAQRFVDWISGCAIMFRRELLEQVGGFDERFFYYNEEVELCFRARKAGWKVLFVPQAKLWHKGVQRNYKPNPYVTYYSVRNQLLFLKKHSAPIKIRLVNLYGFTRMVASWTIKKKWQPMHLHRDAAVQAILDYMHGKFGKRS
jgi:GT2 family glycosyltransferase